MKSNHKITYSLFINFIFCLSCQTKNNVNLDQYYKIAKIDSINNFYIINIKGGNAQYKIISKKESAANCNHMQVGNGYSEFVLEKMIIDENYYPTVYPEILNKQDFVPNCIKMDDGKTEVCRDIGMDNIYKTPNLEGLCYTKLHEKKQEKHFPPPLKIKK